MEYCYLKDFDYYEKCKECPGLPSSDVCYSTRCDVEEHIAILHRLFISRIELKVEDDFEDMFTVHQGGFI